MFNIILLFYSWLLESILVAKTFSQTNLRELIKINIQFNTGCAPGSATYHSYGYRAARCIFTESVISPRVFSRFISNLYTIFSSQGCIQGALKVAPCTTVMATGLPDAFSRKTLFLLDSSIHLIETCTQCSPGRGVYSVWSRLCHPSDFLSF